MRTNIKTSGHYPKIALRTLLLLLFLAPAKLSLAINFMVDGISYNTKSDNTVEVTSKGYMGYSGNIIIPNHVSYDGITYTVTHIGYEAFCGCSDITSIELPNTIISLDERSFSGCTGLTTIELPNSLETIGASCFYRCTNLTNIEIPNSVTAIAEDAFWECSSLSSARIGSSVSEIGRKIFNECYQLAAITVDENNQHYDSRQNCNAIIEKASNKLIEGCMNSFIPNSIEVIGRYAFSYCNLSSIIIPNSVTVIEEMAFFKCNLLTEITIPESVREIGMSAFSDCSNLETISIPDDVILDYGTFNETKWYSNQPNGVLYLGTYAYGYKGDKSVVTELSIVDGTRCIVPCAFDYCENLISISIPNSVTRIGQNAFYYCTSLTSIVIPDGVKSIEAFAFGLCSNLENASMPNSVAEIGESAFYMCSQLKQITLPPLLKEIPPSVFSDCSNLETVIMSDSITTIGTWAFMNCTKLSELNLSKSLKMIDMEAFSNCTSLQQIIFPNSVNEIGVNAFMGCQNLIDVVFPNTLKILGEASFNGCSNLQNISLPNTIESFGRNVFGGTKWYNDQPNGVMYICNYVYGYKGDMLENTVISINDGAIGIANNAFYRYNGNGRLDNLTGVIIPASVQWLGGLSFYNCPNILNVTCLATAPPTMNGYYAFDCYNTATLHVPKAALTAYLASDYWNRFSNIVALPEINIVSLPDTATLHGNTIVIPVSLENESELTAFQTDLYLPEGFELLKKDGEYLVELSDRKGRDHVIMANDLDDGGIRIISYSTTVKPYIGNEGELFYITVKTPDDGDGDYTIMLKNTLLTTTDHEELNAPDASCTITVYPYILGDANNSGTVTVTDIVTTARYILNYHPDPFVFGAADLNVDGNISVTDIVIIAQLIMDGAPVNYPRRAPARDGKLDRMNGQVLNDDGLHRTVSISLDNVADYTAFQLDLQLPTGMTADNFNLTDGSSSHTLDVNLLDNGKTRLLCYTSSLKAFNGEEGTLLTFDVTADASAYRDIVVDGIEMVTTDCQTVNLNAFIIKLDNLTSVDELKANIRIYSDGQDIVVESPVDVTVNVSDMLGRTTLLKAKAGRTVIPTDGNGIYIVNAGGAVAKLMLK